MLIKHNVVIYILIVLLLMNFMGSALVSKTASPYNKYSMQFKAYASTVNKNSKIKLIPNEELYENRYLEEENTVADEYNNLLIVSNTRGNYGLYPGFYAPTLHPQAKIETHRVMIKWGNYIGESFLENNLGSYVNYLHTYYFINNPNIGDPSLLKNLILSYMYGFSSASSSIVLIGHSSPTLWEAYFWNPNNIGILSYHLLPEDSIWTPPNTLSVVLSSEKVRDYIEYFTDDITINDLPRMTFIIGCNSLKGDITNLDNNWARGFFFTYDDYLNGLWNDRIVLGYDNFIYYYPVTGDFPAAKLVKSIFDKMGSGDNIYDALRRASEDLGFPYKICGAPFYCTSSYPPTIVANEVLLGSSIYNDPEPEDVALNTVKSYITNISPRLWDILRPNISVTKYDSFLAKQLGLDVYEVRSRISYVYPNESSITVIVDLYSYVVVTWDDGYIISFSMTVGNYYNQSVLNDLFEKYGRNATRILASAKQWIVKEKLREINSLYDSIVSDINTTLSGLY